jgi:hypothetical protein
LLRNIAAACDHGCDTPLHSMPETGAASDKCQIFLT